MLLATNALLASFAVTVYGYAISIDHLPPPISLGVRDPLPLVIWHGLGDKFDNDGLISVAKLAQDVNPGTHVYIIRLADDGAADQRASFYGNVTNHIAKVCQDIADHPVLAKASAVNALGFSQGGQFMRGYVQRCNSPRVHTLVTFGSQHNGIADIVCAPGDFFCNAGRTLIKKNTWTDYAQGNLVPAQYFRDPADLEPYLEHSNFLADINNERVAKNALYKKNLASLHRFVMYLFEDDEVVVPKESGWFAEVNRTSGEVTPLHHRLIYKEDWIGLRTLDEKQALVFEQTPGKHMQLNEEVLTKTFKKYYAPHPMEDWQVASKGVVDVPQSLLMGDW